MVDLLRNQRANRDGYNNGGNACKRARAVYEQQRRLLMITSIVCHSQAKKTSNLIPSLRELGTTGVKRRVIEVLSGLGICHSYKRGNKMQAKLASMQRYASSS